MPSPQKAHGKPYRKFNVQWLLIPRGLSLLIGLCLGLTFTCIKTTDALVVVQPNPTELSSKQSALQTMTAADILYLGERHDQEKDHEAQLEIIQAMHQKNGSITIALEMFQRPFQSALDQYIAGDLDESGFLKASEYEQRWGFPWELYAPILQYAKQSQIPVIALNAPSEVVQKVARSGLDSLETEDLKDIPDPAEFKTDHQAYRALVTEAFGAHDSHGHFNPDHFFEAQVTWDETMADAIAQYKAAHPQSQIIVLAGQGHVVYGYGIPERVQRRLKPPKFPETVRQQIVLLNPPHAPENKAIADILWYSEPAQSTP